MKRNLPLYILLIFLVIANGFFLFQQFGKPHRGPKEPSHFIAKQLNFDASQQEKFKILSEQHHIELRNNKERIKALKDALFKKLSDATVTRKEIDSITRLIGKKEQEKDIIVFYHFKEIQKICTEEQRKKFQKIVVDGLHKHGKKRRP